MDRVQYNVAMAGPKRADGNRQDMTVSKICQGLRDQKATRARAIPAKGVVTSALRMATSATAIGKNQHYSQRSEPTPVGIVRPLEWMIIMATPKMREMKGTPIQTRMRRTRRFSALDHTVLSEAEFGG